MDWVKIKSEAKEKINGKLWDVWKPTLIIGLISAIIGAVASRIFGANNYTTDLVTAIFTLLLVPAEVGYISYILKLVRGEEYDLSELKKFYEKTGVLICINILVYLAVLLGFICLVIPGIILSFCYTMTFYIFCDNQSIGAEECLKQSRELIKGYKLNYFGFCLSFLGWALLCVFIIPMVWVVPYITVSQALYYEELKKLKANN